MSAASSSSSLTRPKHIEFGMVAKRVMIPGDSVWGPRFSERELGAVRKLVKPEDPVLDACSPEEGGMARAVSKYGDLIVEVGE